MKKNRLLLANFWKTYKAHKKTLESVCMKAQNSDVKDINDNKKDDKQTRISCPGRELGKESAPSTGRDPSLKFHVIPRKTCSIDTTFEQKLTRFDSLGTRKSRIYLQFRSAYSIHCICDKFKPFPSFERIEPKSIILQENWIYLTKNPITVFSSNI